MRRTGSVIRQSIINGLREQAEKRKDVLLKKHAAKDDFLDQCGAIYNLTHTPGWKIVERWLADIADPYTALREDGTYDAAKLAGKEIAVQLLLRINAMVLHYERTERSKPKDNPGG